MVRFWLNSIGRKGYFDQTDTLLAVLEKYRQQLYKSILRVRVNGKRKDLIYEEQIHHRRYDRKCNLYTHSGGHAGHLSGSKKHECQCPLFPRNSLWILL